MDISKVTDSKAKTFLSAFLANRQINKDYYDLVPEDKFDFRMVNTKDIKSDSPRENLAHQIQVQEDYTNAIIKKSLSFSAKPKSKYLKMTKQELMSKLEEADKKLIDVLSDEKSLQPKVSVPWNKDGLDPIDMLWALNEHEILHTGWNLALMDHLGIERFPSLANMWGK